MLQIIDEKTVQIEKAINFARKHLPKQGPLEYFVHHNTLHSFEHLSFFNALNASGELYQAKTKKSLKWYQDRYKEGRITDQDLQKVLYENFEVNDLNFKDAKKIIFWNEQYKPQLQSLKFRSFLNSTIIKEEKIPEKYLKVSTFWDFMQDSFFKSSLQDTISHTLTKFLAAYFDKGVAYWQMEDRENGILFCFKQFCKYFPKTGYLKNLDEHLKLSSNTDYNIVTLLEKICPEHKYWDKVLFQTLYTLKGWVALSLSIEANSLYNPTNIKVDFKELIVVILLNENAALSHAIRKKKLQEFENTPIIPKDTFKESYLDYFYHEFSLQKGSFIDKKFITIVSQINQSILFKIWHEAYEWNLITKTVQSIQQNPPKKRTLKQSPSIQIVTCIDDREESIRRYFEQQSPSIQTFGYAGHFGLNILYKGLYNAHFRPLCPVSATPEHYIWEEREDSHSDLLGKLKYFFYHHSKLPFFGVVASIIFAPFSMLLFILNILSPGPLSQIKNRIKKESFPKLNYEKAPGRTLKGFTVDELAQVVYTMLKTIDLTDSFAPCVFVCAHGSESMNNPHEAAHDCGACGGGRGAPNARLFALAANRKDVRRKIENLGILIPESTYFIGGYHNTCNDEISIFDKELYPQTIIQELELALHKASKKDAKERVRKFEDVKLTITPEKALKHVHARALNFAQPRPEYGHATNAICIVGERSLTKNIFFDRRAFLVSYNCQKDQSGEILTSLISSIIPVCAGINLEYYFSFVDREVFGSGVKQPHNITSLMGVMNGYKSDLRLGLPWQMVEIHEPVRIIIVIEASVQSFEQSLQKSPASSLLVNNEWVRILLLTPDSKFLIYTKEGFQEVQPETFYNKNKSLKQLLETRDIINFTPFKTL